jgi:hypothetical protein
MINSRLFWLCRTAVFLMFVLLLSSVQGFTQTESASMYGRVTDRTGAVISNAQVRLHNIDTGVDGIRTTNQEGFYLLSALKPGRYVMVVSKQGFKTVTFKDITLNVQDNISRNFNLEVGAASESVTITAEGANVNTADGTVSTVVDRNFAENLPMNGRSFQSLIQLTPGVVTVASNGADEGQFSINGQRADSNYWMVDGVSANIGITAFNDPANGFGGTIGAFSASGGTNSLVSVDAMQEFRIQTSTYAPEFGRTPGGQISIVTRSGSNQFHGTLFEYLRNDVLDANDWFADYKNLPKPEERQNDFGGTFSGPIFKNKTFFFFSYEGLRLRLPQVLQTTVPDLAARQAAIPAVQPFLNAYPFDPNQPDLGNGMAEFDADYSNKSTLDAYSLRVDHRISDKLSIFGRYNYSPSELTNRANAANPLSSLLTSRIKTQTGTLGATWTISPRIVNDFRFNYSRVNGSSFFTLDNFGGAVPPTSLPFPSPFTIGDSEFSFDILSLRHGQLLPGPSAKNLQRQFNSTDSVTLSRGSRTLKFGVDYRRLSPKLEPPQYLQADYFSTVPNVEAGNLFLNIVEAQRSSTALFHNLGLFAQDTWRLSPRATLTYGLRWDVDMAPSSLQGPGLNAVTGYNLTDFSQLAIAPAGTPPFKTTYGNLAPRVGFAYQLSRDPNHGTVLRGGFGLFYDLVSSVAGDGFLVGPPFIAFKEAFGGSFPLSSSDNAPPPIPSTGTVSDVYAFNPNLKLPYTLEWNVAIEQSLGPQQTLSASYIGASGRRLLQTAFISGPPTNPVVRGDFVDNSATSSYNALQLQFARRLSHGLQALASYTWAHSIDDGSADSGQVESNLGAPGISGSNRGPSDFDLRQTLSAGFTYEIPAPKTTRLLEVITGGWSVQNTVLARSALPVNVDDFNFFGGLAAGVQAGTRPDIVPGQPFYLYGANCASVMQSLGYLLPGHGCPGGMALNPNAFKDPPSAAIGPDCPSGSCPARQGTLGRNALRGFGAEQWDFSIHREFSIRESFKLQFRAELFNAINHPNFGQPNGSFYAGNNAFGLSAQSLNQYLDGGGQGGGGRGAGSFSPLYQLGGPRSIQLALRLSF